MIEANQAIAIGLSRVDGSLVVRVQSDGSYVTKIVVNQHRVVVFCR